MMKAYIFVFDRNYRYDYKKFHEFIKESPHISNWWRYIQSCYILVSELPATKLSREIREVMPKHRFLLSQIHLNNSNGWLPKEAWDWIHKYYD